VLGGVDGNSHFPVPSINGLNQTDPSTFSILPRWTLFRDSVFLYFNTLPNVKIENHFRIKKKNKNEKGFECNE
jgi:hypothetical protein